MHLNYIMQISSLAWRAREKGLSKLQYKGHTTFSVEEVEHSIVGPL